MLTDQNDIVVVQPNVNLNLRTIINDDEVRWVTKNTAILVVHGIGFQLPLETLDQFGRGLVQQYMNEFDELIELHHEIVTKSSSAEGQWFDNVLRIKNKGSEYYIDVYEYYWAYLTEDKATWSDLNKWLEGVVTGAKSFYKRNAALGKIYKDRSPFFDTKTGNFITWRYRFFLTIVSQLFFAVDQIMQLAIWLASHIPFAGKMAGALIKKYANSITQNLTNLLVDVVAYNVVDPKSKFFTVKKSVLNGATDALKYLLEKTMDADKLEVNIREIKKEYDAQKHNTDEVEKYKENLASLTLAYPSVVLAAHSLGTQISYDAINRVNLMVNKEQLATYDSKGNCIIGKKGKISEQLGGLITFGCPLDKILFFLRENIPDEYYLRQQFLDDFHGFKQQPVNEHFNNEQTNKVFVKVESDIKKYFENITWRNYYDDKDYISGALDYYKGLTNINCRFNAGRFAFTHGYYWTCSDMYQDIIVNYLK